MAAGSGASATGIGTLGPTLLAPDFVAAIREGRDPLVDGVEGRPKCGPPKVPAKGADFS